MQFRQVILTFSFVLTIAAQADDAELGIRRLSYPFSSDSFDGASDGPREVAWTMAEEPGVHWIQVRFGPTRLGDRSYLTLTSIANGDTQVLNAASLAEWNFYSAFFVGDAVEIVLHVDPLDRDIEYSIRELIVPDPSAVEAQRAQCGTADNRGASGDPAVARLFPPGRCSAWLATHGGYFTAGHCQMWVTAGGVMVEYNVPASCLNGAVQPAAIANQYPILATVATCGVSNGPGDDWAIFAVGRNSNSGRWPWELQGFYRLNNDQTPANVTVTGYGADWVGIGCAAMPAGCPATCYGTGLPADPAMPPTGVGCPTPLGNNCNTANRTQQTDTGPLVSRTQAGANRDLLNHQADTEVGNSGSPVIIADAGNFLLGVAIGIHESGGCNGASPETGANGGTGFKNTALSRTAHGWRSDADCNPANDPTVRHVDGAHPDCDNYFIDFTLYDPSCKVLPAISGIPAGSFVRIVAGTYRENYPLLNSAMTIQAPVGGVLLGRP